jgi:sulfite exporter TauE/SafE
VAYTLLGFFLGLVGSFLQLNATTRAILQAAIGIFMVGSALRMLNVHPIFRYFAIEPPSGVTRYIRRKAKGQAGEVTPIFLGALTVLIPCGVTQAMMAVAMGSGSPLAGAMIMFAFILGTSPVFFGVAYMATRLGQRLETGFMRFVAVVLLVLGLISINSGLTLMGSPYAASNIRLALQGDSASGEAGGAAPAQTNDAAPAATPATSGTGLAVGGWSAASDGVLTINVGSGGYSPKLTHAKANQAYKLSVVTKDTYSCARAFTLPALGIEQVLPPTGTSVFDVPPQPAGSKLYFSCSMGMYNGMIAFDS